MRNTAVLVPLAIGLASACGPKPHAEEAAPPPENMPFKDMNKEQRADFMKNTVVPTMKPLFQEFNAEKFATFDCKTCHGAGADDHSFKMPNPDLPVLPGTPEAFMAYAEMPEHAPWVQFMAEKVKPTMANLLQMSEFDPQTNTGDFGCHACHTIEGAAE